MIIIAIKTINCLISIFIDLDYFLNVHNDICYDNLNESNIESNMNNECSEMTKTGDYEVNRAFIEKYGASYEHKFKLNDDGDYYWFSTEKYHILKNKNNI